MVSTVTVAHVVLAILARIVNTKSTNVIQVLVNTGLPVTIWVRITHVTARTVILEKIVMNSLTGVHSNRVKTGLPVFRTETYTDVIVLLDGLESYVTLKMCPAKMQLYENESTYLVSAITVPVKMKEDHIVVSVTKAILDHIVKLKSTNVNRRLVKMVVLVEIVSVIISACVRKGSKDKIVN